MSKTDCTKNGRKRFSADLYRLTVIGDIEKESHVKKNGTRQKALGIRAEVLEAYASGGMGAVSEVLDRWNKKLGQVVYTLETAESWIEEKYPQGVDKDDEHDR